MATGDVIVDAGGQEVVVTVKDGVEDEEEGLVGEEDSWEAYDGGIRVSSSSNESSNSSESLTLEEYAERYCDDAWIGVLDGGNVGMNVSLEMDNGGVSPCDIDIREGATSGVNGVGGNPLIDGLSLSNRSELSVESIGIDFYEGGLERVNDGELENALDSVVVVNEIERVPGYESK